MINKAMQSKLETGEALDVLLIGEEVSPGLYRLFNFDENVDYCDGQKEAWIWSIGKSYATGEIWAATDTRFYQNEMFECIWLR